MTLDNFRTIELIWDKANKSIIKTIKTASSDTTGRFLSVKVLDGGQEVTLNNAKLQLYWEHPNFNTRGTDNFETVNNGGLFKMAFSQEMLTNIGKLTAHLVLTLPDGKITSDGFTIEVIKGANDGVVVPTNGAGLVKQIDGKIDKGNVTLGDLTQEVKLAMTGGAVAVVGENAVGTENIKDGAVSKEKTNFFKFSENLFDKTKLVKGKSVTRAGAIVDNALWNYFETNVIGGQTYTISHAITTWGVIYDDAGTRLPTPADSSATPTVVTYTMPENAKKVFLNVRNSVVDQYMFVKGSTLPTEYVPYFVKFDGLTLDDESVKMQNLSKDLQSQLDNSQAKWAGKNGVTFGDSITFYDGKTFGSQILNSGEAVVGYQSYMRDELGVTIDNRGVSGNHLTQILAIVKGYDFTNIDFATITSGANDWSQQRLIGSLALPQSTFDENTFYGALQSAVEFIINANSNTKIVLITPVRGYHPTNTHSGEWLTKGRLVDGMLEQPDDYAQAIKEVAELYGLDYVDFRDFTGLNFLTKSLYLGDDPTLTNGKLVHPNNLYYEKMGKHIVSQFKTFAI